MKLPLSAKISQSPYSMFSVVLPGGGEKHKTEMPGDAQFTLMGTVVIDGELFGRACGGLGVGYNPFELYGHAKQGRGEALPPHLIFAELTKGDESACAFLNAFGPLRRPYAIGPWDQLTRDQLKAWSGRVKVSPAPEVYFPASLGIVPLLPSPLTPQSAYVRTSVSDFWRDQAEFNLTLRLHSALCAPPSDQYNSILRILSAAGISWSIKGPDVERRYVRNAIDYVRDQMNSNLDMTTPTITRALDGSTVRGVWGCYSLLEAMYLMLFLDIASRNAKIVQCEKCSRLFYSSRQKGKYCSPECENRARALRSYYKKKGAANNGSVQAK
jgi:hypothetical protein